MRTASASPHKYTASKYDSTINVTKSTKGEAVPSAFGHSHCGRLALFRAKTSSIHNEFARPLFKQIEIFFSGIRHFHIPHNAPYLPPKFCITFVFHLSRVLQPSQEKLNNASAKSGGTKRCIMGNVEWRILT